MEKKTVIKTQRVGSSLVQCNNILSVFTLIWTQPCFIFFIYASVSSLHNASILLVESVLAECVGLQLVTPVEFSPESKSEVVSAVSCEAMRKRLAVETLWLCGAKTCITNCSWTNKRGRLRHPTARQLDSVPLPPRSSYWLRLNQSPYWSQMKHWTHQYVLNASLLFNHLPFKSQGSSPTWCICFLLHKFALSFRGGACNYHNYVPEPSVKEGLR